MPKLSPLPIRCWLRRLSCVDLKYFFIIFGLAAILPEASLAEFIVAKRTIRSHAILSSGDFELRSGDMSNAVDHPTAISGLESRRVLYKGRPVMLSDVGPAAIIQRNQIVTLVFANGPLFIAAEGRSLGRAGVGDILRVLNLGSRTTVSGTVDQAGQVVVGPASFVFQK